MDSNRISAGRLFEIAQVLGVGVSWFFEGLSADSEQHEISPRQRMCLELARNFAMIEQREAPGGAEPDGPRPGRPEPSGVAGMPVAADAEVAAETH
ncbi:hypothetical protein [Dankookia sp. P2]|uniref:hypothetical protein n=1 Tax=Dankookia sp. P2 TaxID=3423955 RepID=UPI003D665895